MISVLDYALIAVILAECAVAAMLLLRKEPDPPANVSLEEAFHTLELSIKQSYPNLLDGYTWKEALIKINADHPYQRKIKWAEVEDTLKKYEAFRYGGITFQKSDSRPILRLSRLLRRREWIVR